MARPRAFESCTALEGAIEAFIEAGYRNAPIRLLETKTGLASGSIYNAFGDKRGLYRAALTHYVDVGFEALAARYGLKSGGFPELRAFLHEVLARARQDCRGCLLTNALVEAGGMPDLAPAEIAHGLERLRQTFKACLSKEVPDKRLDLAVERLLTFYQGLCVRLRGEHDPTLLGEVIDAELNDLRRA